MLLINRNMNKKALIEKTEIITSSMAKLTKATNITTDALCKIYKYLNCDFGDIMEHITE